MNERQAQQNGYQFHGAYGRNKDEMKQRAKQLREEGNKAIVVNTPDDKLSRGGVGMGYSVYWIESEASKAAKAERSRVDAVRILQRDIRTQEAKLANTKTKLVSLMTPEEYSAYFGV